MSRQSEVWGLICSKSVGPMRLIRNKTTGAPSYYVIWFPEWLCIRAVSAQRMNTKYWLVLAFLGWNDRFVPNVYQADIRRVDHFDSGDGWVDSAFPLYREFTEQWRVLSTHITMTFICSRIIFHLLIMRAWIGFRSNHVSARVCNAFLVVSWCWLVLWWINQFINAAMLHFMPHV